VPNYGSKDDKSKGKGGKTEKGSGSKGKGTDMPGPVLYPATHRPKGKGSNQGQSR
jgi:hypothetical protein